jgi:hypothetical protein
MSSPIEPSLSRGHPLFRLSNDFEHQIRTPHKLILQRERWMNWTVSEFSVLRKTVYFDNLRFSFSPAEKG